MLDVMESFVFNMDSKVAIGSAIMSIFILTKVITYIRSFVALRASGEGKAAPILSYYVPFAGNIFGFTFDTLGFISKLNKKYGPNLPIRIRVLNMKINYISGAESVLALFKGSRDLTTVPASILVLQNAFGHPVKESFVFTRDNTGIFAQPLEGSNDIPAHNRLFQISHKVIHSHLMGPGLNELAVRFIDNLKLELDALDIGFDEWVSVPDLYDVVRIAVFRASTIAMCGPRLLELNPQFTDDFWEFDTHVPNLFRGLPKFLIPSSFRCRDRCKAAIRKWHKDANERFAWGDEESEKLEWEENWGARMMRERQSTYSAIDGMSTEAIAANDLGMLWGANANIVPLIGWSLLDVLSRPTLLTSVLTTLSSIPPSTTQPVNMPSLLTSPLLQSIYSEELRVRNGVMIQRVPVVPSFTLGPWKIPKDEMIIASSWHEHRDRKIWNEGPDKNGELHPVDDFWAERFLIYPDDPNSGPRNPKSKPEKKKAVLDEEKNVKDNTPKFSTDSVTGSFIPYGGGQKICPGRFYAKQEAIGALALFLTEFEIELVGGKVPEINMEYFPFGVVPPLGKYPARLRRRRRGV